MHHPLCGPLPKRSATKGGVRRTHFMADPEYDEIRCSPVTTELVHSLLKKIEHLREALEFYQLNFTCATPDESERRWVERPKGSSIRPIILLTGKATFACGLKASNRGHAKAGQRRSFLAA